MKPSKPKALSERSVQRQGRSGPGDGHRISGRINALKAEAQERYRGETNPVG